MSVDRPLAPRCKDMTSLSERKTRLVIETSETVRYRGKLRPIIIELKPYFCSARLKGTRVRYDMPWMSIFTRAAQISAELEREQRMAKKKARRK